MMLFARMLALVAAGSLLGTSTLAQTAREIRGASPYVAIDNEPAPKLIVDPPLPDQLSPPPFSGTTTDCDIYRAGPAR